MASVFERFLGRTRDEFVALNHEQRAGVSNGAVPDLHRFLNDGVAPLKRPGPSRTRALAASLFDAMSKVVRHGAADQAAEKTLADRIITDELLRTESDRDQNVYLTALFTRTLTQAVPDVVFQPASLSEVCELFRWARAGQVPVTLRGAGSTAMGGSVPNDGGVTLDLARLDMIDVDAASSTAIVGAGARLRHVHERLAQRGLALKVYPSNLGGTLAGWFVTGGAGLNAFSHGVAVDSVRIADVVLPNGEHVRFHADGRIDVPGEAPPHRNTLTGDAAALWFTGRGLPALTLRDFAGSEGVFGLVLHLTVVVEPLAEIGAFLLAFRDRDAALEAARWIAAQPADTFPAPSNLKLFTQSHFHHVEQVWRDEDSQAWRTHAQGASTGLPWKRIAGPKELGVAGVSEHAAAAAYLFVDFHGLAAARAFARALASCPGAPAVMGDASVRFAAERFRPQQTKRLGPGLLAAEVVLAGNRLRDYLRAAEGLARGVGVALDSEVYFLRGGEALVIAGYLTDHRRGSFAVDLTLAPALTELAMSRFGGRPYVLGRWQSAWFERALGAAAPRIRAARTAGDPTELLNRGIYTGLKLRGALGGLMTSTFVPGIALLAAVYASPLVSWIARGARGLLGAVPGPAAGHGAPARIAAEQPASEHAIHCVNCGECNSVCPIFSESKIRLPQMLTHIGEAVHAGGAVSESAATLLDLCMRCGNCEEACQAGIPHLSLYEGLQRASDAVRPRDVDRHSAVVAAVRGSQRYREEFLDVRGGMYLRRTPVALPGVNRFVVLRAENDAGAESTCIHCGACVPVCPTNANLEFAAADPRLVTTDESRCIGCGTCVEVCPANQANGGQTLRVMEAPTPEWFVALTEFEKNASTRQ